MESHPEKTAPHILYSCYAKRSREGESFISQHVFGYVFSGGSEVHLGGNTYHFNEGDFRFFRKNQLSRYTKFPPPGGEYKSISVYLDEDSLRAVSQELDMYMDSKYTGEGMELLKPTSLLKNYIASLKPYLDGSGELNKMLTQLKVKEAIMILLETNPALKNVLFDFSAPGKIDLEAYMNEHYKYNVDLKQVCIFNRQKSGKF